MENQNSANTRTAPDAVTSLAIRELERAVARILCKTPAKKKKMFSGLDFINRSPYT